MLTVNVRISNMLSFEKGGYKTEDQKRVDSLMPGEKKSIYYDVYPKHMARAGELPMLLHIIEHYNQDYKLVQNEIKRKLELTVME